MAKKASKKVLKKVVTKASKKTPKKHGKKTVSGSAAPVGHVNFEAMALELEKANTVNLTGGAPVGACLISHPGGPHADCHQYTEDQCKRIGGTWVGGPC